jgi:hypothetical protein
MGRLLGQVPWEEEVTQQVLEKPQRRKKGESLP